MPRYGTWTHRIRERGFQFQGLAGTAWQVHTQTRACSAGEGLNLCPTHGSLFHCGHFEQHRPTLPSGTSLSTQMAGLRVKHRQNDTAHVSTCCALRTTPRIFNSLSQVGPSISQLCRRSTESFQRRALEQIELADLAAVTPIPRNYPVPS